MYAFIFANGVHIGVTTGSYITEFSGITKKKGNTFRSSNLSRKCQSSHFLLCDATVLLRWSLQYVHHWLQFPNNRCSIQSYCTVYSIFQISDSIAHKLLLLISNRLLKYIQVEGIYIWSFLLVRMMLHINIG